jgi:hypothetical protein
MRSWMRAWLVMALVAAMTLSLSALACAMGGPADPGAGQQMTLMKAEADKSFVMPGEEVRFLLQIKSTGTRELAGPLVVFDVPATLMPVTATSSRGQHITVYEKRVEVDVVNLMYGDTVDITIVCKVKPDVPLGTAIVSTFQINSAYAGSQQANIGITVGKAPAQAGAQGGLPKAGGGLLALLLVGIALGVAALVARGFRVRQV